LVQPTQARATEGDALVVGAGHNGLVAATLLARAGLRVVVLEGREMVGGAARTERPFARAPGLGHSTGAYLLGLMPPELMAELGLSLPLLRRDPHYFLPTRGDEYLLLGSDEASAREQLERLFGGADLRAHDALQRELSMLREDLAGCWLQPARSLEETAERHVRRELRETFVALCRGSVGEYLQRFGFRSELLMAMYAVTDGFSGVSGGWDTPGTGHNFLVHNMCRLPGAGGTWMVVQGGMGTVTERLAGLAREAGVEIALDAPVQSLRVEQGQVRGAMTRDGREFRARCVLVGADPFAMLKMTPEGALDADYVQRIEAMRRPGTTFKLNLCLDGLPRFRCLPEDRGQFRTTIHVLPEGDSMIEALRRAHTAVTREELAEQPTIEWYTHTVVDPSLQDAEGHHSAALFVQWVPPQPAGSDWERQREPYARHLLSLCERLAPDLGAHVVDMLPLAPPDIEARFGMSGGHIHHVDNTLCFDARVPHRTPVAGLYCAGAGCHPAGSVIGAAGHNAARQVLADMGVRPWES
jgi:phytoene dehydrogenase-like protein